MHVFWSSDVNFDNCWSVSIMSWASILYVNSLYIMGFSVYPWDSQYIRQDIHGIWDSRYIHEILCIPLSESIDSHFDLIVNMHGFGEEITAETCLQTPHVFFNLCLYLVYG